jgi:hypothetical protein
MGHGIFLRTSWKVVRRRLRVITAAFPASCATLKRCTDTALGLGLIQAASDDEIFVPVAGARNGQRSECSTLHPKFVNKTKYNLDKQYPNYFPYLRTNTAKTTGNRGSRPVLFGFAGNISCEYQSQHIL